MTLQNNDKLDYGKETVLNVKSTRKKVIQNVFSSPFESKENEDILKETANRAYRLLYDRPESPNPSVWSNSDIKNFMTFFNAPSTKPNDVGGEKGIPKQIFDNQGAPAATYFPCLNSPGAVAQTSGDISDGPKINVSLADTVKISPNDIKASYYVVSPSETSSFLGNSSLVKSITLGASQYSISNGYSPAPINNLAVIDITKNNSEY